MRKINELKEERADVVSQMRTIAENETLTKEQRTSWNELDGKVSELDSQIQLLEKQERLNKQFVASNSNNDIQEESVTQRYVEALRKFFRTGIADEEFRGYDNGLELRDDLLTSTDAGLVVKDVEKKLNIAKTPILLDKLGTKKMTGMKGQFDLTAMAQVTANFVGETVAVPDASAYPQTPVTLAPRRLGASQVISREALDSTNPNVWADVVQDILDAFDRKVSSDAITQLIADAVDASTSQAGSNFAYVDVLNLQANIPYDMVNPVYLASPAVAAKLAGTVSLTGVEGPIWKGNIFEGTIAGVPAYSNSSVPANHLIFVDAAKITTAEFSPKSILYNPYEYDAEGKVKVTVSGTVDSGFGNYRFASYIPDCSIA